MNTHGDQLPLGKLARITGGFYLTYVLASVLAGVLGMIRKLNREQGQTFVLVTHDAEVGEACDRIIRMRDGLVLAVELVNEPTSIDVLEPAA